jgi:hypothetical protein
MIKREDLLKKLEAFKKIDNGPKDNTKLDKSALLDIFKKNAEPKTSGISEFLNKVPKNPDLSNAVTESKNVWTPKTSIKEIHKRIVMEATFDRNKPNVFRLNIETLVLDKIHSKFKITRGPEMAIVEIMYPNANDKITVKFELDGVEDKVVEVGLEDEEYTNNFSNFIINNVDSMIKEKQQTVPKMDELGVDTVEGVANRVYSPNLVTGYSPIWEAAIALVEADKDVEAPAGEATDSDVKDAVEDLTAATPGETFGEDEFKLNTGETKLGDFGGDFGSPDIDIAVGGEGDVNKAKEGEQAGQAEEAPDYSNFIEKTDWANDSLNSMQKLVSTDVAKKMQSGTGVVLTQDEILNGMPGIKGDSNFEIIDKFLKVYKELDGAQITVDMLDQIEDKLALDDGQFDTWLQAKLPEITGAAEVTETLNNEMFEDFKPMGGEPMDEPQPTGADTGTEETLSDFLSNIKETGETETEEDKELKAKAEEKAPSEIKTEFPNI